MYSLSTHGVENELMFALWPAVSEIEGDLQSFHIWARNPEFEERSQSCIYTLFLPQGVENEFIFFSTGMVIKIWQFFTLIMLIIALLIGMITKIITVITLITILALMALYCHLKFESAVIHQSQDMDGKVANNLN